MRIYKHTLPQRYKQDQWIILRLVAHISISLEVKALAEEGVGRQKDKVFAPQTPWGVAAEGQTAAPWEAAAQQRLGGAEPGWTGREPVGVDPDPPHHCGSCSPRWRCCNSDTGRRRSRRRRRSCFCDPDFGLCRMKRGGLRRGWCEYHGRPCWGACGGHTRPGTWG